MYPLSDRNIFLKIENMLIKNILTILMTPNPLKDNIFILNLNVKRKRIRKRKIQKVWLLYVCCLPTTDYSLWDMLPFIKWNFALRQSITMVFVKLCNTWNSLKYINLTESSKSVFSLELKQLSFVEFLLIHHQLLLCISIEN